MAVKRILRVFPTRTSYTPTDELAFCDPQMINYCYRCGVKIGGVADDV